MTHRHVHLVGSVPLADATTVFTTVASVLGAGIRRIPDGETKERLGWIGWQHQKLGKTPWLRPIGSDVAYYEDDHRALFEIIPGTLPDKIVFSDLGYAAAALQSYAAFVALKKAGKIAANVRFQVSLPTPLAIVASFVAPSSYSAVEVALENRMLIELAMIVAAIPADQLAIQWDVAVEFAVLELGMPVAFDSPRDGILERLRRLGNVVPENVDLGYHLCYGDLNHSHFKEPETTATLVSIANGITQGLKRKMNFLHFPVPRNRHDDDYFAPLADLKLQPQTELYLGLIHLTDGIEGARRRITAASRHYNGFGIATECGFGRRPPETVISLLNIHRDVATTL